MHRPGIGEDLVAVALTINWCPSGNPAVVGRGEGHIVSRPMFCPDVSLRPSHPVAPVAPSDPGAEAGPGLTWRPTSSARPASEVNGDWVIPGMRAEIRCPASSAGCPGSLASVPVGAKIAGIGRGLACRKTVASLSGPLSGSLTPPPAQGCRQARPGQRLLTSTAARPGFGCPPRASGRVVEFAGRFAAVTRPGAAPGDRPRPAPGRPPAPDGPGLPRPHVNDLARDRRHGRAAQAVPGRPGGPPDLENERADHFPERRQFEVVPECHRRCQSQWASGPEGEVFRSSEPRPEAAGRGFTPRIELDTPNRWARSGSELAVSVLLGHLRSRFPRRFLGGGRRVS
jgi:hypothetical protein